MRTNIARQPILNKTNETIAYKLLFRGFDTSDNIAIFDDGSKATTEVIKNWIIHFGIDQLTSGKKAFINFTEELLINKMPRMLRKDSFIIELAPNIELTDEVIDSIVTLHYEGYDFAFNIEQLKKTPAEKYAIIEILKIDFIKYSHKEIIDLMKVYNLNSFILLAEKIETYESFELAKSLGFKLFQGYYFAVPTIFQTNALSTIPTVYFQLIEELNNDTTNSQRLAEITKNDVVLTYSVLNIVNSIAYYSRRRIKSLQDAYTRLGMRESKKVIYYNFLKTMTPDEAPGELMKKSLIRGKQAELLSYAFNLEDKKEELFLLGLFSLINIILKDDMEEIIERIHLSKDISNALLGMKNELSSVLDLIILYERNYEKQFITMINKNNIDLEVFTRTYLDALKWSDAVFN